VSLRSDCVRLCSGMSLTCRSVIALLAVAASPASPLVLRPAAAVLPRPAVAPQSAASKLDSSFLRTAYICAMADDLITMDDIAKPGGGGGGGGADGGAREGERERGRTAVISRPKPKPKNERKEDVDKEPSWRVLLHNDDVHTFDYVTMAIVKVVKTITRKKAHRITVQAHSMGTATVTTTWKQMAKTMCLKLQKFGLTSSIAPDSSHTG